MHVFRLFAYCFMLLVSPAVFSITSTNQAHASTICSAITNSNGGFIRAVPRPAENPAECTLNGGSFPIDGVQVRNFMNPGISGSVGIGHINAAGAFTTNGIMCTSSGNACVAAADPEFMFCFAHTGVNGDCTLSYNYTDSGGNNISLSFTIPQGSTTIPAFTVNGGGFEPDVVSPVISEVTPVSNPINFERPNYTFTTNEAGTIGYGGDCSSATSTATVGNNTVTFNTLADGPHNNCTITVTDGSGNVSNTLNVSNFTVDTMRPTVGIATDSGGSFNQSAPGTFTATITFSEPITGFADGELTATNANVGPLTNVGAGNQVFTSVVTPNGIGNVVLNVPANVAQDTATNNNTVSPSVTVNQIDDIAPTLASITRQTPATEITNANQLDFLATFSEPVSGINPADFEALGTPATTATAFQVTNNGDGTVRVRVSGGDLAGYIGTIGLGLASGFSITDVAGNALANNAPSSGTNETYTLENTAPVVQSINRDGTPASNALTVDYVVTFDESANNISIDDFELTTTGSTTANIASVSATNGTSVTVTVDTIAGGDGSLRLDLKTGTNIADGLGNAGPAAFQGQVHTVAFPKITLFTSETDVTEGNSPFAITATTSLTSTENINVTLGFAGTATRTGASQDYANTTSILTILAGDLTGTTQVSIVDDAIAEPVETIVADIIAVSGGNASEDSTQQVTITLNDNDAAPTLSIDDVTIAENAGGATATFTVTKNGGTSQAVTVEFASSNGTATAGSDYTATSGTLNFAANETTKTFDVIIADDAVVEADETATLTLSNPSNATISDNQGTLTITNDDTAKVTIDNVAVNENAGTATITLTLDNVVDGGFSIDVSTTDVTATTADSDYTAVTNSTETFAGTAGETETLTVTLGGDTEVEADETVALSLSNLVPTNVDASAIDITDAGTLTINNDDVATVTIADVSGNEDDGAITVIATLDVAVNGGFSVDVSTADGTATIANSDYTSVTNQTLTFAGTAGETEIFTVTPTADVVAESNETVSISMSNEMAGTVDVGDIDITDSATVTINNDDNISASINDPTVAEGTGGTTNATFTVTLSQPAPAGGASVDFTTSDGTAIAGNDYTATGTQTLNFAATQTTKTFTVTIAADSTVEGDETVTATLSNPVGTDVIISDATGTLTITNDDSATVSIADNTVAENAGNLGFIISLSNPVSVPVSVNLTTADGSAAASADYTAQSAATQTFPANSTASITVNIAVSNDALDEPNETFTAALDTLSAGGLNVSLGTSIATGTINDDDATPSISIADISVDEDVGDAVLTAILSAVSGQNVTFNWSTNNGSAIAPGDFTAQTNQPVNITAGSPSAELRIPIIDDADEENLENLTVTLSALTNSSGPAGPATVTISKSDSSDPTLISFKRQTPTDENTNADILIFSAEFSEPVSNVTANDFEITGTTASVSNISNAGNVYSITVSGGDLANLNGTVGINLAAGQDIADAVGNALTNGEPATDETYSLDNSAPTVQIQNAPAVHDGATPFAITVQFSEDVLNFAQGDVTVAGAGTITRFTIVDANTYTVEITPNATTAITVDVAAGVAQDAIGNDNTLAPQVTVSGDTTSPSITAITAPASHDQSTMFAVTIVFSEPIVAGTFVVGDLVIDGGTAAGLTTADNQTFTVNVTPAGPADVTIDVPAGVTQDAAGNLNLASAQAAVKSNIVEQTQQVIRNFVSSRANHIMNNQPSLVDFVTGGNVNGGGPLGFLAINGNEKDQNLFFSTSRSKVLSNLRGRNEAVERINHAFRAADSTYNAEAAEARRIDNRQPAANALGFASSDDDDPAQQAEAFGVGVSEDLPERNDRTGTWDVWTELYGSRSRSGTSDSTFWVGYLGAHYFLDNNTLVGIVGQVDFADESNPTANSRADGTGWMIGPYIAGQFEGQDLFYEARVAFGTSSNTVAPVGTFSDDFDTTRWLASGKITGIWERGDYRIRPELSISWYEETQKTYTDSLNNVIPEQTVSLGEFRFGPTFEKTFELESGLVVKPSFGVSGVYNFDVNNNNASQGSQLGSGDFRARFEAGYSTFDPATGVILLLEGFYDGIGTSDYYTFGGRARLTVPLP